MTNTVNAIPKVELHVHVEGTVTPEKCRALAAKNNITLPDDLFTDDGHSYHYNGFVDAVTRVYFTIASTIKTAADYEDVTYDYLRRCAAENTLYVELIVAPGQCAHSGISYRDMIDGVAAGITRARTEFNIESRINLTFERIFKASSEKVMKKANDDAELMLSYKHDLIVGLDIAGGEDLGDIPQFRSAYMRVMNEFGRPLGCRMHAAENASAQNARDALDFGVTRIGHGVQVIMHPQTIAMLRNADVMLEVCPTSNILALTHLWPTYESHPLRELYDSGLHICLNSDDPGLFHTSIGREYQIALDHFGFTDKELFDVTRDAIGASFAPDDIKRNLYQRVETARQSFFNPPRPAGLAPAP